MKRIQNFEQEATGRCGREELRAWLPICLYRAASGDRMTLRWTGTASPSNGFKEIKSLRSSRENFCGVSGCDVICRHVLGHPPNGGVIVRWKRRERVASGGRSRSGRTGPDLIRMRPTHPRAFAPRSASLSKTARTASSPTLRIMAPGVSSQLPKREVLKLTHSPKMIWPLPFLRMCGLVERKDS